MRIQDTLYRLHLTVYIVIMLFEMFLSVQFKWRKL